MNSTDLTNPSVIELMDSMGSGQTSIDFDYLYDIMYYTNSGRIIGKVGKNKVMIEWVNDQDDDLHVSITKGT